MNKITIPIRIPNMFKISITLDDYDKSWKIERVEEVEYEKEGYNSRCR